MPDLVEDVKHIPPWLLVAGVGGLGALFLLVRRSHPGAASVSAGATNTGLGSITATPVSGGPDASTLQSISTLPRTATPAPGVTRPGFTLSDILHLEQAPRNVDQNVALLQTAAQIDPNNQQLQGWANQGIHDYNAPGHGYDPGGEQAWLSQGYGFLTQYANQDVAGVGIASTDKDLVAGSSANVAVPAAGGGGGGGKSITDVLPFGYATEMTSGILADWADWMGHSAPRAGLNDKQRYVARATHHELSARHKQSTDDAVAHLLGGV